MMHFVLDQNFPIQATGLRWPPTIALNRLRDIDPDLTRDHEDWEIFRALARRADVDGFITNDADILHLPREMVMLLHTELILVVVDGLGSDPLGATGLLMVHLTQIAKQSHPRPNIYILKRSPLNVTNVRTVIHRLAARANISGSDLMAQEFAEINQKP